MVKTSLWEGPAGAGRNGGVTQGLLKAWLSCRERARVKLVDGLRPSEERWSRSSGYGNFWHRCEQIHAGHVDPGAWEWWLLEDARRACREHPADQEEINHWYNVCRVQFPLYRAYWAEHPDTTARTPLFQEQTFDVPYALPGGRTVRLRGRWDSVDVEGKGKAAGVVLMENKTKGEIDEPRMVRQLTNDLQSMLYLVAFQTWQGLDDYGTPVRIPQAVDLPIRAIRYNVVRRPLSGGRGSIVRRKGSKNVPPETAADFYARLRGVIAADPGHFFMRWRVEINAADLARFRRETLDPVLEQLCDWWDWVSARPDNPFARHGDDGKAGAGPHWVTPFGGVNGGLDEYGSPYDEFLRTGSTLGLQRSTVLFPELEY